MRPMPTLRQMQFFLALVRRQNFSKAAEDCLISQSTLSSAIKEMEALLGHQLVDRSSRTFGLTPTGEDFAARAGKILALCEDTMRAVEQRQPLEGAFNLGVIPTIAPFLLPSLTAKLKKKHPKLELFLREDLTENLAQRLSAGLLDAALLALPYDLPGTDHVMVQDDEFYFVCEKKHRFAGAKSVTLEQIRSENMLLLEDGHCLREHAIDSCALSVVGNSAPFGGTSLLTLVEMVRLGLGATLLPAMAVSAGMAKGAHLCAIPIAKPKGGLVPRRQIAIAWRQGSGRREEVGAIAALMSPA